MLKTRDPGDIRRRRPFYFRQMFSIFYPHPRSRSVSGWMFGDFLNWFLEAKQPRKVFEMEEGTLDTVNLSYTANLDNIRVSTTKTTIIDLSKRIETIRYDKLANVRPREGCLYIPLSRDGQMLDLFAICTFDQTRKPVIWLFHGTVVATHDIKVEPFSTLASWQYPIHYVAVVPGDFHRGRRTFAVALPRQLHDTVKGMWILPIDPSDLTDHYYDIRK